MYSPGAAVRNINHFVLTSVYGTDMQIFNPSMTLGFEFHQLPMTGGF
jgi:hypothetical protein